VNKKLFVATLVVVIAIVIALVVVKSKMHRAPTAPEISLDTSNQPTTGNTKAKIHFVAFEDLKCVNCAIFNTQLYPKIKEKYIDTGAADYTMIPLAFIPGSIAAGNAAYCLYHQNTEDFFNFVDYVYENQPDEMLDWATPQALSDFAKDSTDANIPELQTCIKDQTYYLQLQDNLKYASDVMGEMVATPRLFINGNAVEQLDMASIDELVKSFS
jgi:protein-disulfide isomerase